MNISRFVVLGTLDRLSPASGYDILRDLDEKMISHWTGIKKGSVYHALKTLHQDGCILETERVKQGLYPTSVLFTITESGRAEFDRMQAEAFLGLFPYYFGFKLALKFNVRRSTTDIADFADQARKRIDRILNNIETYLNSLAPADPRSLSDPLFIEHEKMLLTVEKKWIAMAVAKLSRDAGGLA